MLNMLDSPLSYAPFKKAHFIYRFMKNNSSAFLGGRLPGRFAGFIYPPWITGGLFYFVSGHILQQGSLTLPFTGIAR
ncbi:MAG: hypothetical protein OEZ59_10740 [Deltaproteobacteria bacterium]|nr:hypothetical protein [Deltaproteobacteria bacterium]